MVSFPCQKRKRFVQVYNKNGDLVKAEAYDGDGSRWFLAVKFDRENPLQNEMEDNCEECFLFDSAPHHLLKSSAEFIICEGPHKVGAMVILPDAEYGSIPC